MFRTKSWFTLLAVLIIASVVLSACGGAAGPVGGAAPEQGGEQAATTGEMPTSASTPAPALSPTCSTRRRLHSSARSLS